MILGLGRVLKVSAEFVDIFSRHNISCYVIYCVGVSDNLPAALELLMLLSMPFRIKREA